MTKEDRKLQTRLERHRSKSEIRKSDNPEWLDKWVERLDDEMDDAHEKALYAKKTKVRKATNRRPGDKRNRTQRGK